ncbi:MAG TPA: peptidyl-alpha-hydroxyglycine alpha-amidating lyase family protein [Panacibacter sp.]|mgnify:FL=1|nr:peptidyl-alpha-hydroxyglycine alpha-amidating lyase family protein [Panacibacter sp.]HNP43462.1 peptidyl-alpha-hydroxyglycine alpha-amidating lyase family protein [Panacibacter sp.]
MKIAMCCMYISVALFCGDNVLPGQASQPANMELAGYELVKDWPRLPAALKLGNPTGIGIDSKQHVFVFQRAYREWPLAGPMPDSLIQANTVLELDRDKGTLVNSWGSHMFIMPHGLTVDKDDNIWLTDVALQQVFKFSHDGKLLMSIGTTKIAGDDGGHFNMPTDVAVTKNGAFYVSDGYGNSRVAKFSADGKFLFAWGKEGSGPGEFNIPHGITLDENENVVVADRENRRVQLFDSTGKFLREYAAAGFGNMYSVTFDKKLKEVLAVDYIARDVKDPVGSDVIIFDSKGDTNNRFGRSGSYEGPACRYHDIATDDEGNIYVGDIYGNMVQKFRKTTTQKN